MLSFDRSGIAGSRLRSSSVRELKAWDRTSSGYQNSNKKKKTCTDRCPLRSTQRFMTQTWSCEEGASGLANGAPVNLMIRKSRSYPLLVEALRHLRLKTTPPSCPRRCRSTRLPLPSATLVSDRDALPTTSPTSHAPSSCSCIKQLFGAGRFGTARSLTPGSRSVPVMGDVQAAEHCATPPLAAIVPHPGPILAATSYLVVSGTSSSP